MTAQSAPSTDHLVRQARRFALPALVLTLLVVAFAIRVPSYGVGETEERVFFHDGDTVRRLLRLEELATATSYPNRSAYEGYPDGPTSHWTRPMDWVIQALDVVVPKISPRARSNESGAAWAGPVLGALAALACALLLLPWLGAWPGTIATGLLLSAKPLVETSRFGNGDHQTLQHLALTIGLLGFLRLVFGAGGRALAVVTGLAMGLSVWVTIESLAPLFLCGVGLVAVAATARPDEQRAALAPHLWWSTVCLGVCLLGNLVENPGRFGTLQWDRISLLAIVACACLVLFCTVVADLPLRTPLARALAGALGLAGLLAVVCFAPGVRAVLGREFERMQAAQRWGAFCINEYQPLLQNAYTGDELHWSGLWGTYGWIVLAAPIVLVLVLQRRDLPFGRRAALAVLAAGTFALSLFEVKFAPLFALVLPLLLVFGGIDLVLSRARSGELRFVGHALGVLALALSATSGVLGAEPPNSSQMLVRAARAELVREVNRLRTGADDSFLSVLGPWQHGAHVMYYCRRPVVASAFHRNMAGIEDSFRVMLRPPKEALPILQRRKVRWVIYSGDPWFLVEAKATVPDLPTIATPVRTPQGGVSLSFLPEGRSALWSGPDQLRGVGFELHLQYESEHKPHFFGVMNGPMFRLYRVVYDGEK